MSYAEFARIIERANAPEFNVLDGNNSDLSAFHRRGGKLLTWHGIHDEAIPV